MKKAAGGAEKNDYEDCVYEGYGPNGVAVIVECLTDNRNRTAGEIRHYFDKFGGNLGQMGCVGFMFTQKGVIVVDLEDKDPDELMMDALDAGADDFDAGEDAAEVTTSPENFTAVCEALEKKGYKFISADVAQVPSTTTALTDPDQLVQMGKLLDALDDDDDVQNAWHTLENEEDLDEDAQLVILSVGEDDEGEYLDVVEDDETLLEVSKLFEKRLSDQFEIE